MQLGLGTAALGRPQYINVRQDNAGNTDLETFRKHSFSVLEAAYNSGIRYFDTAPGYGLAEELVLEWVKTKNDTSIEIATKWGYTYTANFDINAIPHFKKYGRNFQEKIFQGLIADHSWAAQMIEIMSSEYFELKYL